MLSSSNNQSRPPHHRCRHRSLQSRCSPHRVATTTTMHMPPSCSCHHHHHQCHHHNHTNRHCHIVASPMPYAILINGHRRNRHDHTFFPRAYKFAKLVKFLPSPGWLCGKPKMFVCDIDEDSDWEAEEMHLTEAIQPTNLR